MRGISEKFLMSMKPAEADFYVEADSVINFLLEECQELNSWQPIESAPENKSVIVFDPMYGPQVAMFIYGAWRVGIREMSCLSPTHWQELPPSPELPEPTD